MRCAEKGLKGLDIAGDSGGLRQLSGRHVLLGCEGEGSWLHAGVYI